MRVIVCPHCRNVHLVEDGVVTCPRQRCIDKQAAIDADRERWLSLAREKHARRRGPCGQLLYDDLGRVYARCTVRFGTEHTHHDHTAEAAVLAGLAEAV